MTQLHFSKFSQVQKSTRGDSARSDEPIARPHYGNIPDMCRCRDVVFKVTSRVLVDMTSFVMGIVLIGIPISATTSADPLTGPTDATTLPRIS